MKRIDDKELKSIEIDILVYIDSFCSKNNIKYSLCGGTLLGAIRHKGFIPWDDDIDIFMVRDQYDKFVHSFENNDCFELINYKNTKNFNYLFSKVVAKKTKLVESHNKQIEKMGVFVDVFPVDSLGDTLAEAKKRLKKLSYKKYLGIASNWKHFYINPNHGVSRQFVRFLFFILSRTFNPLKVYGQIESTIGFNQSFGFYGCIPGSYGFREIMDKSVFLNYKKVYFEGRQFMIIDRYHDYLTALYGDYMQIPPLEKQVSRHTFVAYWREND